MRRPGLLLLHGRRHGISCSQALPCGVGSRRRATLFDPGAEGQPQKSVSFAAESPTEAVVHIGIPVVEEVQDRRQLFTLVLSQRLHTR